MQIANSDRPVTLYSLDVIISVGYRVNSLRGTQVRQWATRRLKEYLEEGIAINERRLEQKNKELRVLHDGVRILGSTIHCITIYYVQYCLFYNAKYQTNCIFVTH
jgi:hypothetical protein